MDNKKDGLDTTEKVQALNPGWEIMLKSLNLLSLSFCINKSNKIYLIRLLRRDESVLYSL